MKNKILFTFETGMKLYNYKYMAARANGGSDLESIVSFPSSVLGRVTGY